MSSWKNILRCRRLRCVRSTLSCLRSKLESTEASLLPSFSRRVERSEGRSVSLLKIFQTPEDRHVIASLEPSFSDSLSSLRSTLPKGEYVLLEEYSALSAPALCALDSLIPSFEIRVDRSKSPTLLFKEGRAKRGEVRKPA